MQNICFSSHSASRVRSIEDEINYPRNYSVLDRSNPSVDTGNVRSASLQPSNSDTATNTVYSLLRSKMRIPVLAKDLIGALLPNDMRDSSAAACKDQ